MVCEVNNVREGILLYKDKVLLGSKNWSKILVLFPVEIHSR